MNERSGRKLLLPEPWVRTRWPSRTCLNHSATPPTFSHSFVNHESLGQDFFAPHPTPIFSPFSLFFSFHSVFLFAFKDLNLIEGGQKSRTACCPRIVLQLQAFEACIQIENFLTCQSMRSFIPHALLLLRCIHCRDLANFCPLGSGED